MGGLVLLGMILFSFVTSVWVVLKYQNEKKS